MNTGFGKVISTSEGWAEVAVEYSEECATCAGKSSCHSMGDSKKKITVLDPIGVEPDQWVYFKISSGKSLQASFLVYGLPILVLLIGAVLGQYLGSSMGRSNPELWSIFFGFLLMGLSFIFIFLYSRRKKTIRNFVPVITEVKDN